MAQVEEFQRALNLRTAGAWPEYAGHRQRVTELVGGSAQGLPLCVLGAGNCNDIDLTQLVPRFRQIVLVDIDAASTESAVARQPPAVRNVIEVRAPVDFSGLAELSQSRAASPATSADIANQVAKLITREPFDLVVSTCVLSQIIDQVRTQFGEESERCLPLVQAVRELHLLLLLQLLRVGGRGVLISDMVSSDTAPNLAATEPQALPVLMARLVAAKNFFTGLNPFVIEGLIKQHPSLAPLVARTALHPPWLWQLGSSRSYLTFAMSFQRR